MFHTFPELCLNGLPLFCQTVGLVQKYQGIFCGKIIQKSHRILIEIPDKMLCCRKVLVFFQAVYRFFYHMGQPGAFFCEKIIPELLYHGLLLFFDGFQSFFQHFLIKDHLRCRIYGNLFQVFYRTLAFRVKAADGINFISPQFDPDRIIQGQGENIDNAAPDRKLPRSLGLGVAFIAHSQKLSAQFLQIYCAVISENQGMVSDNFQRKKVIHASAYTGDHGYAFFLQECGYCFHPLPGQKIPMNICLKKDQVPGRI